MDAKDIYQFNPERTHQGLALVIANFTKGKNKREGAEADLKYMKKTFKRLGFKVDCHENVKGSELVSLLKKYSQQMTNYDCFVFAISSHGMEAVQKDTMGNTVHQHAIEMFDGTHIYTKSILDHFSDENCRALKDKPKLFFIQACRIPETKCTQDHFDAGEGFDPGDSSDNEKDGQDQGTTRDQTDSGGSRWETEIDFDMGESDVSDTDVEEDESSLSGTARGQVDGEKTSQNLEKRQKEIFKKLKRMEKGQTEILKRLKRMEKGQTEILKKQKRMENQNEEPSPQTTASQNKQPSLQANGNEDSNSHSVANENKETNSQNTSGVTVDSESRGSGDDVDRAKAQKLYPPAPVETSGVTVDSESRGSGDDVDRAKAQKLYSPAPVEITLVPCHNDMLIMFASPQGHYAFRNKVVGSYLLQLLYKCVEKYYANGCLAQNQTNFFDVLREVSARMSVMKFMGNKEYTNVPCVVHKLGKDLIFTQGKNMVSTKFSVKLYEIISSCGLSFITWSNKN